MDLQNELDRAAAAAGSGDLSEARRILKGVIEANPNSVAAWELLADVVTKPEHVINCLEQILKLDPGNESARQRLAALWNQPVAAQTGAPVQGEIDSPQPPIGQGETLDRAATQRSSRPPKKKLRRSRSRLEIILVAALGLSACCVIGLLVIPFNSLLPGGGAADRSPTVEEITFMIYENVRASNDENIDLYMSTLHSMAPAFHETREVIEAAFENYDLSYTLSDVEVVRQNENEAVVAFELTTRKIRGPGFRNNRVTGQITLRMEDGVWKIYQQKVENIEYLD